MRLNYSGVDEDAIREGVRRIGKVVAEQVALYSTLTGAAPPPAAAAAPAPAGRPAPRRGRSPPRRAIVPLRRRAA